MVKGKKMAKIDEKGGTFPSFRTFSQSAFNPNRIGRKSRLQISKLQNVKDFFHKCLAYNSK